MADLTPEQLEAIRGSIFIKNISGEILTLVNYGQYEFAVDEELNLLDDAVPDTLRAGEFETAKNMIGYAEVDRDPKHVLYELGQLISEGKLKVTNTIDPDITLLQGI